MVVIVVLPFFQDGEANISVFGNLLIFFASIAFSGYGLLSKKKQKTLDVSPLVLTFYYGLMTLILSLPFMGYELVTAGLPTNIGFKHIASAIYVGLFATGALHLSYQNALKFSSEVSASLFTYLQPVSNILLAAVILDETITLPFIIGGVLAIVGAQIASE